MSTPASWMQAQRLQQHPSLFRSATPPPSRPRSAAAPLPPSPPLGGRHVIPRSHSALHDRPPSAPRLALPDRHPQQPIVAEPHAPRPQAGVVGVGSQVNIDYSAIQRIADGVERMVRSWKSENSCRAQVYAKAYDSLHAAIARRKDGAASGSDAQDTENSSSCTEPAPFKFTPHPDKMGAELLDLHCLQSPADPHSVEMAPCIFDVQQHPNINSSNVIVDNDTVVSSPHQQLQQCDGKTSRAGGYNVANLSVGEPSYTAVIENSVLMENVDCLYSDGALSAINEDADKEPRMADNELCTHNRTHRYPIGLGFISEDDDMEPKSVRPNTTGMTTAVRNQLENLWVMADPQQVARSQCMRGQQQGESGESRARLQPPQQLQRSNQPQNMPLSIRSDLINSNSVIKSRFRSRSPSLRRGILAHCNLSNFSDVYHEGSKSDRKVDEKYEAKVKELEISLLECATEYEVQLVEMKMKMLQMKSEFRQKIAPEENKPLPGKSLQNSAQESQVTTKLNRQANICKEILVEPEVEPNNLKRRTNREEHSENVPPPKPKPRIDAVQRKPSSDDREKIVTCLQKLLSKKEQELLYSKLREKELSGQIRELQTMMQRGRSTQMEPKKLLSLLLALSEWLQSVKTGVLNDDVNIHRRAYQNVHALAHLRMNPEEPLQNANRTSNNQSPRLENLATIVNKEIKTLQEKFGKLTPYKRRTK